MFSNEEEFFLMCNPFDILLGSLLHHSIYFCDSEQAIEDGFKDPYYNRWQNKEERKVDAVQQQISIGDACSQTLYP